MHPKNELENLFFHFNPNERLLKVLKIFRQTSEGNRQRVIRELYYSLNLPRPRIVELKEISILLIRMYLYLFEWNVEYQTTN